MISLHLDIVDRTLVASISNHCDGAARLPFKACQAHLLHVPWPVNLALFKASPHDLEPNLGGQSSEEHAAKRAGLVV
jgi:hypothetical protein